MQACVYTCCRRRAARQRSGYRYALPACAAAWALGTAMTASAFYRTIVIDGEFDDWDGVPVAATDPAGDHGGGPDLAALQIANDETHLYLRITYHEPVNPNLGPSVFLALDNDVNAATGFDIFGMGVVGSEAGWQNDFPFQQSAGVFNSGDVTGGGALIAPYYTVTTSQEYAIRLDAVFESDGSPVFPQSTFRILVYTDPTPAYEVMGPVTYTLSPRVDAPVFDAITITDVPAFRVTNSHPDKIYRLETGLYAEPAQWAFAGYQAVGTGGDLFLYDAAGFSTGKAYRIIVHDHLADSGLSYVETTDAVINPERGFYKPMTKPFSLSDNTPISEAVINQHASHFGILHLRFGLDAFSANAGGTDAVLTDDMLAALNQTLSHVRNSAATAILRFSYNLWGAKDENGNYIAAEPDMDLIETHIAQIGGVLTPYADVIACVETGMFGPWGEQHGTPMSEPATNYFRLVEAWLDAAPSSRTVNVRRPLYYIYWANIKYGWNLTTDNLHTHTAEEGSAAYRVGVYNDGYLGSATDLGTFSNRASEVAWLNTHATHTFYGGEVVADSVTGGIGAYNNMDYISQEGFVTRTTYLNIDWNYHDVISVWQNTPYTGSDWVYRNNATAFTYINNRLGYRLILRESLLSGQVRPGHNLTLKGSVENVGFGNVINEKAAQVIIQNEHTTHTTAVDLDIRTWMSQTVSDYELFITLPDEMEPGSYNVYLRFSDMHEQSPNPLHRAIRFANDGDIWSPSLGANFIGSFDVMESSIPAGSAFAPLHRHAGLTEPVRARLRKLEAEAKAEGRGAWGV